MSSLVLAFVLGFCCAILPDQTCTLKSLLGDFRNVIKMIITRLIVPLLIEQQQHVYLLVDLLERKGHGFDPEQLGHLHADGLENAQDRRISRMGLLGIGVKERSKYVSVADPGGRKIHPGVFSIFLLELLI